MARLPLPAILALAEEISHQVSTRPAVMAGVGAAVVNVWRRRGGQVMSRVSLITNYHNSFLYFILFVLFFFYLSVLKLFALHLYFFSRDSFHFQHYFALKMHCTVHTAPPYCHRERFMPNHSCPSFFSVVHYARETYVSTVFPLNGAKRINPNSC